MKRNLKIYFQALKCLWVNAFNKNKVPVYNSADESIIEIKRGDAGLVRESIPKIIWMYWHDEKMPFLVSSNIENIKSENPSFEVKVLNKSTVKKYLPSLIFDDNLQVVYQTDIIRLLLLKLYGGVWIDATTLLFINLNWINNISQNNGFDVIAYYRDRSTVDHNFPIIENWFLAAPKESIFISNWLDELLPLNSVGYLNYYLAISNRFDFEEIKQGIINPEYLISYLAEQIASRKYPNFNAYLIRSETSALLIQDSLNSNYKTNYYLCRKPIDEITFPVIKLCSGDRMFVDVFYRWGMIKKRSIIGRVLQKNDRKN